MLVVTPSDPLDQACDELQFTLDDRWPFTPIVWEAFKSPSGPAQAGGDGHGPGMAWDELLIHLAPKKMIEKLRVATTFGFI